MARRYLTDSDAANFLRMTTAQFRDAVAGVVRGGTRKRNRPRGRKIDLNAAKPEVVGGHRRWDVRRLAGLLDVDEEAVAAYIGTGAADEEPPKDTGKPKRKRPKWYEPDTVATIAYALADG